MLPGAWAHYLYFSRPEEYEPDSRDQMINLSFLLMHILALLFVWASHVKSLDLIYWGMIIISTRNVCPLYGIKMDFELKENMI